MNKDTIFNKVIGGFAWNGATKLIVQLFTWITTIFVARILMPEDYGVVAISGVFIGALLIITEMGFTAGLVNLNTVHKDDYDSVFWLNIFISFIVFIIVYFTAPLIGSLYDSVVLVDIIRISGLILPLSGLKVVPQAIAMRNMDYKFRALVEMLGQFVTGASSIILALNGFGVWTLVLAVLIGQGIVSITYLRFLNAFPRFVFNINRIFKIASYSLYLMGSGILSFFTRQADILIIGFFLTETQVGLYAMAFHLATMPLDKIGSIFNSVAFPAVSRIKSELPLAKSLFLNLHKYLLLITYPVLIGISLLSEEIVQLVLTDKWVLMVPILQAFCILNLLRISGMIMPSMMAGLGSSKSVFHYNIVASILLPIAFLIGVNFDMKGVIISWFITFPLLYIFLLKLMSSKLNLYFVEFFGTMKPAIFCSIIMVLVIYFLRPYINVDNDSLNLVLVSLIGALSYMVACWLLFKQEVTSLVERIKSLRASKA
jgi:O-antigen/teichoic acid export membrane protein